MTFLHPQSLMPSHTACLAPLVVIIIIFSHSAHFMALGRFCWRVGSLCSSISRMSGFDITSRHQSGLGALSKTPRYSAWWSRGSNQQPSGYQPTRSTTWATAAPNIASQVITIFEYLRIVSSLIDGRLGVLDALWLVVNAQSFLFRLVPWLDSFLRLALGDACGSLLPSPHDLNYTKQNTSELIGLLKIL